MTSPTNTPANAPGSHDPKRNAADPKSPSASAPSKPADGGSPSDAKSPGKRPEVITPSVGNDPKVATVGVKPTSPVATSAPVPASKVSGATENQGVRQPKSDSATSLVVGPTPSLHTSPRDPTPIVPNDPAQPRRSPPVQASNESQPAAGTGDSKG
jgi:hypothetical protein